MALKIVSFHVCRASPGKKDAADADVGVIP